MKNKNEATHAESKAEIQKLYENLHTKQATLDSLQNQIKNKPEVKNQSLHTDIDLKDELNEHKLNTKDQVIKDLTLKLKSINDEHAQEIYDLIAENVSFVLFIHIS